MLPSFVMQIEFLSSQKQVSHKDFFFFQVAGADLTCSFAFLQDSYLQQFPNELCQCSCWSDPLDQGLRSRMVNDARLASSSGEHYRLTTELRTECQTHNRWNTATFWSYVRNTD